MSIGWAEGTIIYEIPTEPVRRRQLSQRQRPRSSGSAELGKSTFRLKDPQAQVDVMLVVILIFEGCECSITLWLLRGENDRGGARDLLPFPQPTCDNAPSTVKKHGACAAHASGHQAH
jgi:hypothetical protein